jgi:glycosyltransferase involved in cell wall biosynthesis
MRPIAIHGDFSKATGLGVAARRTLEAMAAAGATIESFELDKTPSRMVEPDSGQGVKSIWDKASHMAPESRPIQLIHTNPDRLLECVRAGTSQVAAVIRHRQPFVGYWAWETVDGIPDAWKRFFGQVSEIWVPSGFVANAVAPFVPCPVICMPHPIGDQTIKNFDALARVNRKGMYFLSIFDGLSGFSRKNPIGVIEAWRIAFPKSVHDISLIIKTKNLNSQQLEYLRSRLSGRNDVFIFQGDLPAAALAGLISGARGYVSLHRSEGFGLTMAEAMSHGVATIGTSYSGNLEFMNSDNSALVDFKMTALQSDEGYYKKGTRWADPDPGHAAMWFKKLAGDPEFATELGNRGKVSIFDQLNLQIIGRRMLDRIHLLERFNRTL